MNRMSQTLLAAALLLVAAAPAAHAAPTATPAIATFETVDQVKMATRQGALYVKGVLSGQTEQSEFRFSFYDQAGASDCQKQAMLAMAHPGRYMLTLSSSESASYYYDCTLTRR